MSTLIVRTLGSGKGTLTRMVRIVFNRRSAGAGIESLQVSARALPGTFERCDGFRQPSEPRIAALSKTGLRVLLGKSPLLVVLAHSGGIYAPEQGDIRQVHVFLHAGDFTTPRVDNTS